MTRTYVIAELGINHNGDFQLAKQLIQAAKEAGADCVKFQKRTLPDAVPVEQRLQLRETPWGPMTYLQYKERLEFNREAYDQLAEHCRQVGIEWTVSVWDADAVAFMQPYRGQLPFLKVPSAKLTDMALLEAVRAFAIPVIASTGMSTMAEVARAVAVLRKTDLTLMHTVSTYPADPEEVNLRVMQTLQSAFQVPVGYSGHERGLQITLAAVARGAHVVERHLTLDRAMWGTDQAASLEPHAFARLVRDIRVIEAALGGPDKAVQPRELAVRSRLRGS